jgi:hypothetical protein
MTDSAPHQHCVHAGRREPGGVAVHGRQSCGPRRPGIALAAGPMGLPRLAVVFWFWQCDKKNHGWREGPPVTVLCQSFRSAGRAFTLRLNQFRTKKEYSFTVPPASLSPQTLAGYRRLFRRSFGKGALRTIGRLSGQSLPIILLG